MTRRRITFFSALAASLALLAYHVAPLWRDLTSWGGTRDWLYFFFMAEVDRITILHYHQFPLWNPYYCGGAVHLANPQTFFLSPTLIFILLFGTPIGIRLTITTAILLAFDGVRRLTAKWTTNEPATMLAGCVYAVSGAMAQHLGGGHVGWLGFGVLPYVLVCLHRALDGEPRFVTFGAFALAWIFGHFGVYPYPYAAMTLAVYAVFLGHARRRFLASCALSAAMVVLSLAFSALRLLPILEFIAVHPRAVSDNDALNLKELFVIYTDAAHPRAFPGHQWVWPEYGNYLGLIGLALFFLGVFLQLRRRARGALPLLGSAFVFLLFQLGNTPSMPWWILKQLDLPIIRNLRVPSRFTIVVGMFAAVVIGTAVGYGLDGVARAWKRRKPFRLFVGLGLFAAGTFAVCNASTVNRREWNQTFGTVPPDDTPSAEFHQQTGNASRMYAYPRANRGSIACFEESPLDISKALRGDLPADEYLSDPGAGSLRRIHWSPNRIELDVDVSRETFVVVNQNYERNWHVEGGSIASSNGLLSARIEAGRHRVVFSYFPHMFAWGLAISLVSMLAALSFAFRTQFQKLRHARHSAPSTPRESHI